MAAVGGRRYASEVPASIFDHVRLEDLTVATPASGIERAVAETINRGERHVQRVVRVVVRVQALSAERQYALESADPAIDRFEMPLIPNSIDRICGGQPPDSYLENRRLQS